MKVWILTEEYNQYDQHGAYFLAWWWSKPTKEQLFKYVKESDERLEHILNGGGRIKWEDQWYNLNEVEEG